MVSDRWLYCAAAVATVVAGIVHLIMAPGFLRFNMAGAILFFVGGATQVFWAVPMIRKWGRPWYATRIGGMAAFIAIWIITRFPANPITGRGSGVNANALIAETAEFAFIGLAVAILMIESRAGNAKAA